MGFQISRSDIDKIVNSAPQTIERVLKVVKEKLEEYKEIKEEEPVHEERPVVQGKKNKIRTNIQKIIQIYYFQCVDLM